MKPTRATLLIDRLFGIDGDSAHALAINDARIAALQPRMPWVYAMVLLCMIGMIITFEDYRDPPLGVILLCAIATWRGIAWVRMRKLSIVGGAARRRLRSIAIGALLNNLLAAFAIASFCFSLPPEKQQLMMIMTATCTIAFAAPLTALPSSARLSYLLFAVPAAALGTIIGAEQTVSVACFNLVLCGLILAYLLKIQDHDFVGQVSMRLDGEAARHRAEAAEQTAIEERSQARELAASDFLTGLANRRAFLAALNDRGLPHLNDSVMLLDLDGFKAVNDTFGHDVGDQLLVIVADRLRQWSVAGATAARLGGDEFAVLIRGLTGNAVEALATALVAHLSQPYAIGDALIGISACCGIATLAADERDPAKAMRAADLALYRAKALERGSVVQYSSEMGADVQRRDDIESALRVPGVEHDIELLYQPIVELGSGQVVAFEALARWTHSRLGPIAPSDFIPMTEQMQLVEPISQALLARAAGAALAWAPGQRLSFNLSAVQLCSWGSAQRILRCIEEAGLAPSRLQIEVTETAMMADFATARHNLAALQERGVRIALDDFGAGHASIRYLREMRFDELKLDGSLLAASQSVDGARLLKGVVDLADAIGTPCTAEHVETTAHLEYLASIGCANGQGYFLGRPMSADAAARLAHVQVAQGERRSADRAWRAA